MKYRVVYSDRKTISLCIKDGGLLVRAPYGTKKERIESIVASHDEWIKKHIERQVERNKKYEGLTEENRSKLLSEQTDNSEISFDDII